MKISRTLAHKLQNLIQAVMGYIKTKREKEAIRKLKVRSALVAQHRVETVEDCPHKPGGAAVGTAPGVVVGFLQGLGYAGLGPPE